MSVDEQNTDENRWNRLHLKNLSEIGESDEQRATKELPVFGMFTKPYMDWKYGRISGAEAVGGAAIDAAIEGATTVAGGAVLKRAGKLAKPVLKTGAAKFSELLLKSKSARMARFGENLSSAYSSKKVAPASTSGASASKNVDNVISEAERKGFHGIRGSNNSAGLELKNTLQLEGRTYLYSRNLAQNVDGRLYTGHALDQMQNRGIPLSVVRNAIEKGKKIEAKRNCWEYIDRTNCVSVITAKDTGNVITVKWRK